MAAAGIDPPLPDLPSGSSYLLDAMWAICPVRSTAEGSRAVDWPEIYPFMAATRTISEPFEAETLFKMCQAYFRELQAGKNPLGIPPMERE